MPKSKKEQPLTAYQPVQAVYSGDPVTVADGTGAALTLDALVSGTDLLDRSDPAAPKYLAAGTYALTVQFSGGRFAATPGGSVEYTLNPAQDTAPAMSLSRALTFVFEDVLTAVVKVTAGEPLQCAVFNGDGGGTAIDFNISSAVIVNLA